MREMEMAIRAKENPLKLAETRLENRKLYPTEGLSLALSDLFLFANFAENFTELRDFFSLTVLFSLFA